VTAWRGDGAGVSVTTEEGETFRAARLVITAGPWAPHLLADLGVKFIIRRKHLYWFPRRTLSIIKTAAVRPTSMSSRTVCITDFHKLTALASRSQNIAVERRWRTRERIRGNSTQPT
jgi:glycine/D-amino acid oxidase-like deaminating enzyme